jgi:MFS family permease
MKISRKRVIATVIILACVMIVLSTGLSTMSYRKMQANIYVHKGVLNTVSAVRKLNYAMSFGKPIDKYFGLNDLLVDVLELSEDIQGIEVIDFEGNSIETVGEMPRTVRQGSISEEYLITKDGVYSFVGFDAGTMILRLDVSVVNDLTLSYVLFLARISFWIFLGTVLAVLVAFLPGSGDGISIKRVRIGGIVILIVMQISLGVLSILQVDSSYQTSVDTIAEMTAKMVEIDINEVIDKGISYEEITGIDDYLSRFVTDIPELSEMVISDDVTDASETGNEFPLTLKGVDKSIKLYCKYSFNQDMIRENRRNNVIDVLILILITVFISLETLNFITTHHESKDGRKKGELYLPGFRLFVFVEGIAFTLDAGFFSVFSTKLYSVLNMPDSMSFLSGLPNTMYSAAVLIGLFGCSSLIRKYGMRRMMTAGLVAGVVGYIFCALSPNLYVLIFSRFIFGFCDGIIINSIRLFASAQKDPQMHNKILVAYFGAMNLGVSCGVVIGGLIADVTSYQTVFLTGAILGAVCLFLVVFAGFSDERSREDKMSFFVAVKELKKPPVLIFMLSVVIPLYVLQLFVSYTFPIFGSEVGFSNSIVSGCLMINFIIIAYLTDPISDWVGKHIKPENAMALYLALQIVSVGIFVVTASIWAAILALVLTSFWDCFGTVLMDSALDHVEGTTREKCTLLQMVFGKLGMVIGPIAITSFLYKGAAGATGVIVVFLVVGLVIYSISLGLARVKSKGMSK